ncbi:hypothetical protein HME9304_03162 [Flagellimonas maritima]|uniref:Uncharacterized protein n=1 Tax=Flagellimonas maritima TaxID=1383885 RepID=A0A2Z4LWN5_9FLAO|nr:TIGR04149 family rSAM-modified RiPP [Allomuricauda aurantiaca]AWX46130.1 hypothetical protein HME9304_03162 [Allomuricauda aurantiaca]
MANLQSPNSEKEEESLTLYDMEKLNLKNLKKQQLDASKMKNISGGYGYRCPTYYCTYVNPNAICCW